MFHTYPDAEVEIPKGLVPNGERSWKWMELGLKTAYLFLTIQAKSDDGEEFIRHFWFSQIDPVIDIAKQSNEHFRIVSLDLFSPGYMNGEEGYCLDPIKEVWQDKNAPHLLRYVLVDGRVFNQFCDDQQHDLKEMDQILAIEKWSPQ